MSTLSAGWRRKVVSAIAAALAVPALAMATSGPQQTLDSLTKASTNILRGKVVAAESRWNDDKTLIVTAVVLQVTETFKGQAALQVTLEIVGGQVEDLALQVVGGPGFTLGEEVLVFARAGKGGRLRLSGLAEAKFTVESDAGGGAWIRNQVSLDRFLPGETPA